MSRVLVTGGSGFIGRHVVRLLLADGHHVRVVDRHEHPDVDTVVGELGDAGVLDRATGGGVEAVVHLAAETSVLGSVERPVRVHEVNVDATGALLELARQRGIGTFVLASTNAVVGAYDGVFTEQVPLRPLTPYGATKAAGEMLLSGYAGAYGLRAPVLRLTNVYGPGMREKDSFVPRMLKAAAAGRGVQVYGDGLQRRDLVHVHDVARAFAMTVSPPVGREPWPSGPTIIGSGSSVTVLDMLEAARAASGREIPAEHVPAKDGEMPAVVVDTSRARSLGWQPEVSLADGMAMAWADLADGSPTHEVEPVETPRR
jgi:UDP-glucose 4-epimerase